MFYKPDVLLLTEIHADHLNYFKHPSVMLAWYKRLIMDLPKNGLLIFNDDDKNSRLLSAFCSCQKISYGTSTNATIRLRRNSATTYTIFYSNQRIGQIELPSSPHIQKNAASIIALAYAEGMPLMAVQKAINTLPCLRYHWDIIECNSTISIRS